MGKKKSNKNTNSSSNNNVVVGDTKVDVIEDTTKVNVAKDTTKVDVAEDAAKVDIDEDAAKVDVVKEKNVTIEDKDSKSGDKVKSKVIFLAREEEPVIETPIKDHIPLRADTPISPPSHHHNKNYNDINDGSNIDDADTNDNKSSSSSSSSRGSSNHSLPKPIESSHKPIPLHKSQEEDIIKTIIYPDGSVYNGEVQIFNDQEIPSGHGTMNQADGCLYEGCFVNGLKHGHGKLTWASGSVYTGNFENGLRHGHGTIRWPSKAIFEGLFELDIKKGRIISIRL